MPRSVAVNFSLLQMMFKLMVLLVCMQVSLPAPCPETSPLLLGPQMVELSSSVSHEQTLKENPNVELGGRHQPEDCDSSHKVAVIIPFRNRDEHLKRLLHHLHPFLQRQQLHYGVYVINQHGDGTFNKAKLMNIGYTEALKDYDYDCFVFSDTDLIPMDDRNTYRCFSQPRHLSVAIEMFYFDLPYHDNFGGVISMSKEQFLKINGFPNCYWGWGGEDDDIYKRVGFRGMSVSRPDREVGKTKNIPHARDKNNEYNHELSYLLENTNRTMATDGISSLSYEVVRREREPLYTNVTVDIGRWPIHCSFRSTF